MKFITGEDLELLGIDKNRTVRPEIELMKRYKEVLCQSRRFLMSQKYDSNEKDLQKCKATELQKQEVH